MAAPANMDSAYERANPVWIRRPRAGEPADQGGQAVHGAVDHPVVEADQEPGEVLAGLHEQGLVDDVAVEVAAGRDRER